MRLPRLKLSPIALLFIVALVLGLGVAWLVMHTLQQREAQAEAALQAKAHAGEVAVVVPTRNLTPGEVADSSTMAERSVPRDLLPPRLAARKVENAQKLGPLGGRELEQHALFLRVDLGPRRDRLEVVGGDVLPEQVDHLPVVARVAPGTAQKSSSRFQRPLPA